MGQPSRRRDVWKRLGPKDACSMYRSPEPRRDRSRSPRRKDPERDTMFRRLEKGVFHMLGDKEKGMSAYSGSSRRQSHHSSRGDTESYYQSSRSRGTEPAPKRHHDRKAYSRKGGRMSESEDSAGEHWKSKSKKQRSSMEDEDLSQPWVCEETDPFTPRIRYFDLPKRIRMPSHVKTYDGSEDPEDHLKIFQAAAKVERWAMPTWCHMFNSTLKGNAMVWFDDLLPESIDSYDDLKEAFLANYLQQKKCIKDPVEIHHIKQREGESMEDFVRRLIKRLQDKIPKSVDEMWKITTAFLRGEVAAGNQERKKTFPLWKQQDARNTNKISRNKALRINKGHTTDECMHLKRKIKEMFKAGKLSHLIKDLEAKQWKDQAKSGKKGRDTPQRGQATSNPEWYIGEEDGTEGPIVIEAEVGGHLVHRMYIDGGASSEIISHSPYRWIIGRPISVKENQSNPVHSPRNVEVPSDRQKRSHCGVAGSYRAGGTMILKGPNETSILWLTAAKEAISAVLMTERDRKQIPIYFVNRALRGPEINYTPMEKLVLCSRFNATNNEAEYDALIAGLKIAEQMGVENL
ncbi:reverse transcriptase domain-containing protein [Tanacetum coccineum]